MSHHARTSSRRTILKGAAWAAPVVVAATAAPAAAAFSATVVASGLTASRSGIGNTTLNVSATVSNTGTASTSGLKLEVVIDMGNGNNAQALVSTNAATGWGTPTRSRSGGIVTYLYTATNQLAAGDVATFSTTYTFALGGGSVTVRPIVDPNGQTVSAGPRSFS